MKLSIREWKTVNDLFKALQEYRERGWAKNLEEELWWDGKFATLKVGPILLTGSYKCLAVHVLMPAHAKILFIKVHDVEARSIKIELDQGTYIRIYPEEAGEWWGFLGSRLDNLDSVLSRLMENHNRDSGRSQLISWAALEVLKIRNFQKSLAYTDHYKSPVEDLSIEALTLSPWTTGEKK